MEKSPITFTERNHTYTYNQTGEKFTSVTTILGKYKKPFDKDFHAKRVADREGVPVEMVLEMWENEKNKACDRGTNIHKLLEDYIEYGEVNDNFNWLYKSYDKSVEWHVDKFDKILSESVLYNEDYKVAGMSDLIYEHKNGEFTVGDFKTNKKFRFSSPFGERMLAPIDHLHNCEFNVYALQLSMYAYMYEKLTGKKCRKCVIFYLKDDSFRAYHVNYLKSDIVALLNHYKINTLNG